MKKNDYQNLVEHIQPPAGLNDRVLSAARQQAAEPAQPHSPPDGAQKVKDGGGDGQQGRARPGAVGARRQAHGQC